MSSLRRHFPHFGLKHGTGSSNSCGPAHGLKPDRNCNSTPHNKMSSGLQYDSMSSSHDLNSSEAISFKDDIVNCVEICSSYIQALNTLCSTGAILAQSLTQVFSRDLAGVNSDSALSPAELAYARSISKSGGGSSRNHRFDFLGSKSSSSSNAFSPQPSSARFSGSGSVPDSTYYDVAEQFLRVWEMMSVSTAGASATIKTETLMNLQEVINKLESRDHLDRGNHNYGDQHAEPSLEHCIQAAKSCLLSYIELQTQFSYNSYKSLSQLSKVLKTDATMADVVKNIKQHFSFNDHANKESDDACNTSLRGGAEKVPSSSKTSLMDTSRTRQGPSAENEQDSFSLEDAINLLSLESASKTHKKRSKRKKAKPGKISFSGIRQDTKSATFDVRPKSFEKQCFEGDNSEERRFQSETSLMKQSTWPGKQVVAASEKNTFYNDWSLWPANPCSHSQTQQQKASVFQSPATSGPFNADHFQAAWNAFSLSEPNSDATSCSVSASASGSLSGGSNHSVGVSSNSVGYELRQCGGTNINVNNNAMDLFGSLNNFLDSDNSEVLAEAAKRLSCSSDGLNGGSSANLSCFSFAEPLGHQGGNSLTQEVRVKTSTWPLKQSSSTHPSVSSNWSAFSPIPFAVDDGDENQSAYATPTGHSRQSLISGSSLWPFEGPSKSRHDSFSLFEEANNNNTAMNKNY